MRIVGQPLAFIEASQIDQLESELWIKLPPGYREYMTTHIVVADTVNGDELSAFLALQQTPYSL